jgi:hypothetical protein
MSNCADFSISSTIRRGLLVVRPVCLILKIQGWVERKRNPTQTPDVGLEERDSTDETLTAERWRLAFAQPAGAVLLDVLKQSPRDRLSQDLPIIGIG